MTTFAMHTAAGAIVGLVKAQEDAPPPTVSGDPGYLVTAIDVADDAFTTSGPGAEARIEDTLEALRAKWSGRGESGKLTSLSE
jgi:hypothetical protein